MYSSTRLRWRPRDPAPAGSPESCRWFVDSYSDYRDRCLDPDDQVRAKAHLAACSACRRYDRVIRTGVSVLRAEAPRPSGRKLAVGTLRDRAWAMDREEAMALGGAGSGITTAGVVLVALLLGGFAWLPLFLQGAPEVEIAPVAAVAPGSEPAPAYSWGDLAPALLSLRSPAGFSRSAPGYPTVRVRVPLTPGVAVGVDPD